MAPSKNAPRDPLREAIDATPIIDHHAHPLLKLEAIGKHSLLSIATEAHGDAVEASRTGLAHLRAVNGLARILGCEPTWDDVAEAIRGKRSGDHHAWIACCLSGIEVVLVDDGLDNGDEAEPYSLFSRFTRSASKRIVRIEQVAARIFADMCTNHGDFDDAFSSSLAEFTGAIQAAIADPEVVGFKSVICYRTGLEIPCEMDVGRARLAFKEAFETTGFERINHPGLNEYLVHVLAREIEETSGAVKKPIQFHTGLGDNDLTLKRSSPAHLQDFIRRYPSVPIVLLHSGYPFTRETAYLAAMYANVYADIGEVFPFLSRDGQEGVVRQILELCPGPKILWSTDGHWFPETYLLAVQQMREVLHTVLGDYVRKGDLTLAQASRLVQDVLFHNPNQLYGLGLTMNPRSLVDGTSKSKEGVEDSNILEGFLQRHHGIRYLRVYFLDLTATPRARVVPLQQIKSMLEKGHNVSFSVTKAGMGLLQNDACVPGTSPVGTYNLCPDFGSLSLGPRAGHCTALGSFKNLDGSPASLCPRTLLTRTLDEASRQGLTFVLGFEIELLVVRRGAKDCTYEHIDTDGHAWSVARAMEHPVVTTALEEAIERLHEAGIIIEMVHAESASGQYEVVLPKAPALESVDRLICAREIISATCSAHGYKMTLHPKPFPAMAGTASHVHLSISSAEGSEKRLYEPFYAGILRHLRAICAFTYSSTVSYDRVTDSCWAGGTWVAWGTQNREAPLRKVEDSHWELKCLDGLVNPYLAMAAIIQAGMSGVAGGDELQLGDCQADPAALTDTQRRELGITERIPDSIGSALSALQGDEELCGLLGNGLVERYVDTKTAEAKLLDAMEDEERRTWIMQRY